MFELATVLGAVMDAELATRGLSRSRAEVLMLLRRHEGPITQRQLSEALRCTPRNVTGLLDALQDAGLVTRNPHPTDRRATQVVLTAAGTTAADQLRTDRDRSSTELLADVPPADLATTTTVVETLLERLHAQRTAPRPTTSRGPVHCHGTEAVEEPPVRHPSSG